MKAVKEMEEVIIIFFNVEEEMIVCKKNTNNSRKRLSTQIKFTTPTLKKDMTSYFVEITGTNFSSKCLIVKNVNLTVYVIFTVLSYMKKKTRHISVMKKPGIQCSKIGRSTVLNVRSITTKKVILRKCKYAF